MVGESETMTFYLIIAGLIVLGILVIGLIFARLYQRASKDIAFVRTGMGGSKVVLDGGALVLPILHSTVGVNLRTLRLEVERRREQAMITLDRMRVDIGVEFYVRVRPNAESIALAAQTLGERTMQSDGLRDLVEAKFVDALRGVAAQMSLGDLHEKRPDFVQRVQNAVAADLEQNGLELESVSLTALDQTSSEYFNPNNAFDAEGLTRLTEITEAKKKERNEIEQTTRIDIETRNMEAEKRSIDINRDQEYARLDQVRDVANRTAQTKADAAEMEAEAKRKEEEARIQSDLAVQQRRIDSQRAVEISEQERSIAVSNKSQEDSKARAEASVARAEAVRADEEVKTVGRVAEAERERQVVVVEAKQEAERQAVAVTVAADAERQAAEDRAEAVKIEAQAEADSVRIKAEADEVRFRIEAEGQRALNTARNVLEDRVIAMEIRLATIQRMPEILEASLKPVEKIKDIRILDLGQGRAGLGGATGTGVPAVGSSAPDSIVDALMRYRMQAPVVDEMLRELGLDLDGGLAAMVQRATTGAGPEEAVEAAPEASPAAGPKPEAPADK